MRLFLYVPINPLVLQETALEVRLHVSCCHRLSYSHWVFQGQQRSSLDDYGFTLPPTTSPAQQSRYRCLPSLSWNAKFLQQIGQKLSRSWTHQYTNHRQVLHKSLDEGLSEHATLNLFQWVFFNDGVKLEDKEMWRHEWLELLLNNEDEDTVSDDTRSSSSLVQRKSVDVSRWLQEISSEE